MAGKTKLTPERQEKILDCVRIGMSNRPLSSDGWHLREDTLQLDRVWREGRERSIPSLNF